MVRLARLAVIAAIAAHAAVAAADPAPWSAGVSRERQAQANALFADGNELFARQAHAAAVADYRAAIAIWDHPMIEFNLAVSLIRLERFVEAADSLDRALRYGAEPFTTELYEQALAYRRLVEAHVATLEVSCTQRGVTVDLDGSAWFACPGTQARRVAIGAHLLVGERSTHVSTSTRVALGGGETRRERVEVAIPDVRGPARYDYPTPRWVPWLVFGVGVSVAIGGAVVRERAQSDLDQIAGQLAKQCPPACTDQWSADRAAAERRGTIGLSLAIGGGVISAGALIWTVVNRPRRVGPAFEIAPSATGGMASARWTF